MQFIKRQFAKEGPLAMIVAVVFGVLVVTFSVQAATTISTNISTGGTLSVTGASTLTGLTTMEKATSTLFSAYAAYFGGSATATISTAGVASFPSTISVSATSTLATSTITRLFVGSTTPQLTSAETIIDGTSTTTLYLTTSGAAPSAGTCIQMETVAGVNVRVYVDATPALVVAAGTCK